ncbi:serine protease inhibitor Kazal-type 6-like isoform X1 [Sphaerodactylus townsendi]|uniref:serine protease inhibitor Kazal-type 6-like isoform X1 n=1 Tax=Sphaerodactylus townsendi TaxID=933632 RepID=UPI002025D4C4|nr:serine protease inhibitor Kazal-type 6-like isoform X1 [Sphaerodactylus townsendi]
MKNTGVLVVFSFALCCFLGVNSNNENDDSKSKQKGRRKKKKKEKYCGTQVSATPMCPLNYNAHCGSNGQTYSNKCEFCNAVWKSKEPLTLKSLGTCESTLQES